MGEHSLNQVAAEIHILLFTDGRITVKGPLENKILCWGILEAAKKTVNDHKINESNLVVPQMVVPKGSLS